MGLTQNVFKPISINNTIVYKDKQYVVRGIMQDRGSEWILVDCKEVSFIDGRTCFFLTRSMLDNWSVREPLLDEANLKIGNAYCWLPSKEVELLSLDQIILNINIELDSNV